MASTSTLRLSSRQVFNNTIGMFKTVQRPVTRQARQTIQTKPPRRHASTSTNPSGAQYHIPKRAVHIGTPLLAYSYLMLYITEPYPTQTTTSEPEPQSTTCTKIHASDLNRYIKSHPDTISDDHDLAWNHMYKAFKEHRNNQPSEPNDNADCTGTHCTKIHASDLNKFIKSHPSVLSADQIRGWNKMYKDFKQHRKNQSEPARIEEENTRLLAEYARAEDIKHRSKKVPGVMATEAGNRSIMHRPLGSEVETKKGERVEQGGLEGMSFSERISARVEEAKRKFTAATKGIELL